MYLAIFWLLYVAVAVNVYRQNEAGVSIRSTETVIAIHGISFEAVNIKEPQFSTQTDVDFT